MTADAFKARLREAGPGFFVAPQLSAADMALARAAGFHTLIAVASSGHAESDARRMAELIESAPHPVLAFCRSSARSELLYRKSRSLG